MNKVFKVVWCEATGSWVAVSEIAKAQGKTKSKTNKLAKAGLTLMGLASAVAGMEAQAATISATGAGTSTLNRPIATSESSLAVGVSSSTSSFNRAVAAGFGATVQGDDAVAFGYNVTARKDANSTAGQSTVVGVNSTANYGGVAIGYAAQSGGVSQSIAIGHSANASGDQSLSIGANTKTVGNSSIAIGGDDLDRTSATGAAQTYKTLTGDTISSRVYTCTTTGEAAVAVGVQARASDLAVAIGTRVHADGVASVGIGIGSNASKNTSVAIGAGSKTETDAKGIASATVNGVTYNGFAGGDKIEVGDQVAVGAVGFERQIKHVAPGEITATSTDAINGSQLYMIAKGLQETRAAVAGGANSYFHVNNNTTAQAAGNAATNFGPTDSKGGATGAFALAAGVNATATGINSTAIGTNVNASALGSIVIGTNSHLKGASALSGGVPAGTTQVGTSKDGDTPFVVIGYNTSSQSRFGDTILGSWAKTENPNFAINQGTAVGNRAIVYGDQGVALGADTRALGNSSVAIGGDDLDKAAGKLAKLLGATVSSDTAPTPQDITNVTNKYETFRKDLSADMQDYIADKIPTSHRNQSLHGREYPNTAAIGDASLAIGTGSQTLGTASNAIGANALAKGLSSTAVGTLSRAWGESSIAMGTQANASTLNSIVLGHDAKANAVIDDDSHQVVIGNNASSNISNQVVMGSNTTGGNMTGSVVIGTGAKGHTVGVDRQSNHLSYENPYSVISKRLTENGTPTQVGGKDLLNRNLNATDTDTFGSSVTAVGYNSEAVAGGVAVGDNARAVRATAGQASRGLGVAVGSNALSQGGGIAIGSSATTEGINSVAIGRQSVAKTSGAHAIGVTSAAVANLSLAIGTSATSTGERSIAIGSSASNEQYDSATNVRSEGKNAIAMGSQARVGANYVDPARPKAGILSASELADWNKKINEESARAEKFTENSIAIGSNAVVKSATAATAPTTTTLDETNNATNSVAIGSSATVTSNSSIAMGHGASASGENSTAIGRGAVASGKNSISVGLANQVSGENSGAFGDPSVVEGSNSYSIGNNNAIGGTTDNGIALGGQNNLGGTATRDNSGVITGTSVTEDGSASRSMVIGYKNTVKSDDVMVLGNNVTVGTGLSGSVILGQNAGTQGSHAIANETQATVNGITYGTFAGKVADTGRFVSVGKAGDERKIINVAAGNISSTSTEAINGSQLYAVMDKMPVVSTVSNEGGKIKNDAPESQPNAVATTASVANAVNNSYWTLQNGGAKVGDVNPGDKVNFTSEDKTVTITAKNETSDTSALDFKVNVDGSTIKVNEQGQLYAVVPPSTIPPSVENTTLNVTDGKVVQPATTATTGTPDGNKLVNATTVANAINNAGWQVFEHENAPANLKDTVTAGDKVVFANGTGTTASVETVDNVTTVKFNANTDVQTSPNPAGDVKVDNNTGDNLVNGTTLVNTVNNASFSLTTGGNTDTPAVTSKVKAGSTVKLVGGKGINVSQADNDVTINAKVDGTTITTNDEGELVANTTTLAPTVNGNIEKPTEGDKLVNATTVANAINESGWKLGDNAGNTNVIKPSTQVNFVNGTNTVSRVTPNAAGNGYDVSYSVANTTLAQTPSPTAPNSVTKFDAPKPEDANKVVNAGDLATALNNVGFNVLAGQTGTGTNSGKVESTAVKTGDTVKFIAGDNVNINQNGSEFTISTSASPVSVTNTTLTPNSTTGKIDTPTQPDGNNLVNATTVANAINNAGWTTSTTDNPSEKVVINPGDAVNYVNGTGTTANVVKNTDGGVNVSYNVNTAEAPVINNNGTVAAPQTKGDHFVNATTLANTLNNVSHNVTIGSDTATFADQDGKKDSQVKAGDTITLKSGKNLIAKQDGNNITFATAENVTFNNVNTTTLSVGGNASQPASANNPVVNFKTEAAKPATNNAANKVDTPTSALNITSADNKPTQITGVGSSLNTENVLTNPAGQAPSTNTPAPLVDLKNATNPTAVATVGDLQNMGWVVSTQTGEYKDTVKNANEVKFIGKDGVTVTGETNAQGVREITVIAETDGTTITTNDEGELVANTTTLAPTVNGNIEKPTEGDKLVNATTVANAINESGWKLGDNAGNTNVIKPSTQVNFVNGTNTVSRVTPNAAGNGYDVSYSVANTTLAQTPSPTAPNSVTKFDAPKPEDANKVVNAGDLATALNNVGFNVLAGQTGTGTNSGKVESTAVKTGDTVKFIAGDNVNINQNGSEFTISTSASPVSVTNTTLTPNSTTGKIDTPTQPDGNNLVNATTVANAINNAGWTTSTTDNPSEKVVINPGDAVNYVNGTGTTANVVKNTDGGVNVSYNVNTAEAPVINNNGTVAAPQTKGDHFVNATTLANTLNNVSHNVTIGSDTATFADQDGKKDSQVKAGDTITLKSGKNLIAKQDGNNITFATAENVTFNNVNTTTLSVGGNASQPASANNPVVNFKTEAAKPATNNAANKVDTPTSALNITSADNKPTQITGVGSSLNTENVLTNPAGQAPSTNTPAPLVDLKNATNPTAVATVGDLQNMGWVVSTQTGEYKDTVKNANEVKFIGTGAATVTGVTNTTNGIREITIDVKTPEAAQLPVVYTTTTGDKVVKAKDGKFYKPNEVDSDGNVITPPGGTAPQGVEPADVIASMNSGGNSSTTLTTLANVKGNLNPAYNVGDTQEGATKKLDGTPAINATPSQTAPANVASMYNNAATVGDVLNAGWNLQENSVAKDFVKAYDTVNFVNGSGTIANVTVLDGGKVANVTYNVKVDDSTIKVNTTTGALEAVIPTDTVASVQNGDTTTVKAEGTTEAPIYKVEVNKAGVTTPTAGTATPADENKVTINEAGKVVAPTNTTVAGNTFLTTGDVANVINNSGWTTKNTDGTTSVINPGDAVNYVNGNGTTANVVTTDGVTTVKYDVNTAKEPTVNPNGTVATPTGAEGGNFVNATTLANTVNNVSWNVTAFGTNTTGAKEEQVKAGEVVTFEAGKNMTLTQNGQNFTYATADNVTFNNVNTTTLSVGNVTQPGSPVVNFTAEAAKPATNNAANKVDTPTSALNITSADNKPTQITGVGSSLNTENVLTNPAGQAPSTNTPAPLVDLKNATNPTAVATVGDLQNMGWVVSTQTGEYKDTVKNANEVKFIGTGAATVTGVTNTTNGIREITIDVKTPEAAQLPVVYTTTNGDKVVRAKDGKFYKPNEVDADGNVITPTGGTAPQGVEPADVIASMNSGHNSTTAPTTLTNVKGNLAPAYNEGSLTENADKKLTDVPATTAQITKEAKAPTGEDLKKVYNNAATVGDVLNAGFNVQENGTAKDFVKAYDTVGFVNGTGTTANVTVNADGSVANVTFNVNKAGVNTVPTDTADASNVTVNNKGQAVKPTDVAKAGDSFLTAGDVVDVVNNTGWTTKNTDGTTAVVKPGNAVNFDNTTTTTANVVTTADGTTTVKFEVNTAEAPTINPNGTVANPATPADGAKLVNATTLANTINNVSWNVTAFGTNTTGAKEEQVKAGEVVTFEAGKNMTLTQNGQNFTYATADNVTFNNVNTTTLSVGNVTQPGSPVVNFTAEAAKPADVNPTTNAPTTALNITSADGKPTQITGVGSSLNTTTVATNPDANPATAPVDAKFVNLGNTTNPLTDTVLNSAATVRDLQNMGWVVSASNGYSDAVKNANEVKFVGGTGITVKGETKGDIREIVIETNAQAQTNNSQLPVVYTLANGTKVYPHPTEVGKFNTKVDGTGDEVNPNTVIASMNSAGNSTTAPTTLANVKGNLAPAYNEGSLTENADKKLTDVPATTAQITKEAKVPTGEDLKKVYNNAATVGDVLNAGFNVQENGTAKDFVKAYDTVGFVNGTGTTANVTVNADGSVANVTFNVNKAGVNTVPTDTADANNVTVNNKGQAVKPTDAAKAGDSFLTAGDVVDVVNNVGWNIAENTADNVKDVVTAGNTVVFADGTGIKSNVTTNNGVTTVKFDLNSGKIDSTGGVASNTTNGIATTGDVVNAINNSGWKTKTTATDTAPAEDVMINPGDTVNYVNGKGTTANVTKNTEGGVDVTYDLNTVNTTTVNVTNNPDGTVKFDANTTTATVTDGKVAPTGNTGGNLMNATEIANAINNSGWNAVANNGANPELINPGETVSFNNGTNVVVTQTGNNFTFATTKDIGVEGNLTVAGNTTLGNVTVNPNSNVNMGNNTVAGVKSNLVDVTPQTNAQPDANNPVDQKATNGNNAATVSDVLNAGWNLQGNGEAVDTVVHNDTVNFVDGRGSNVEVKKDPATGANSIKVNTAVGYVTETGTETTEPTNTVKVFGGNASAPVQVTNVASGVRTQAPVVNVSNPTKAEKDAIANAILTANGDTLSNAANIGDLQALAQNITVNSNTISNVSVVVGDKPILTYDVKSNTEKHNINVTTAINRMNDQGIKFFHTNDGEQRDQGNQGNAVDSSANGAYATAVGYQAQASGNNTVAMGNSEIKSSNGEIPSGALSNTITITDADKSGKVYGSQKELRDAVANGTVTDAILTTYTYTDPANASNVSTQTVQRTRADGERAIAIGTGSQALGNQTIAIGVGNVVTGNNSGAFGDPNIVNGMNSYVVGNNNQVTNSTIDSRLSDVFVFGNNVTVTENMSVALGSNTSITASNMTISTTGVGTAAKKSDGTAGDTTTAGTTGTVETATVNGITYGKFAGATAHGAVSVGASGAERRIQNVAAGEISATSTDAINGSQLYAVANGLANIGGDINNLNKRLGDVEDNAYGGVAQAIATAGLPQAYLPGKSLVAVGAGHYKGETGYAVSFSSISDGGNWIFKGTGSGSSQGNVGGSVAIGYQW